MGVTEYIGARYVPIFADPVEWDAAHSYEALTIVMHQGNSYTSRQDVPAGASLGDDRYWALTGNFNAQVEAYRADIKSLSTDIEALQGRVNTLSTDIEALQDHVNTLDSRTVETYVIKPTGTTIQQTFEVPRGSQVLVHVIDFGGTDDEYTAPTVEDFFIFMMGDSTTHTAIIGTHEHMTNITGSAYHVETGMFDLVLNGVNVHRTYVLTVYN